MKSSTYFGLWLLGASFVSATSAAHPHDESLLETRIGNVQYCVRDGKPSLEADLHLKNQGKKVEGPLTWSYSLCFTSPAEDGREVCVAGGSVNIPEIKVGDQVTHLRLTPRSDLTSVFLSDGKVDKEAMGRLKPKIGTSVGTTIANSLHQKNHYLDSRVDYSCKN